MPTTQLLALPYPDGASPALPLEDWFANLALAVEQAIAPQPIAPEAFMTLASGFAFDSTKGTVQFDKVGRAISLRARIARASGKLVHGETIGTVAEQWRPDAPGGIQIAAIVSGSLMSAQTIGCQIGSNGALHILNPPSAGTPNTLEMTAFYLGARK